MPTTVCYSCHWKSDAASLFPAENNALRRVTWEGERLVRRQRRIKAKELDAGSVLRCIPAPSCKPCAISLTSLLLARCSQWEVVMGTWRAGDQEKQGVLTRLAMRAFPAGAELCLLYGSSSLCHPNSCPTASCHSSSAHQMGLLLILETPPYPCVPVAPGVGGENFLLLLWLP